MSDLPTYAAGDRIGRYLLAEKLGEGGMGEVWKARQSDPIERDVAIKFVKPGMDTEAVLDRFGSERRSLARLDHPDIAAIFDAGSTDAGLPFYVMELVDGQPITDHCKARDLPLEERLILFNRVCRAVQHAHEKGVIHRDIKPGNILVSAPDDGDPRLKIIDFGIAKSIGTEFTQHSLCTDEGLLVGTPGYMSPEQVEGRRDIDGRSDVYSLGALLYELISGAPPFTEESLHGAAILEVMRVIREEEPPRPSTHTNHTHPLHHTNLDWITLKALSKDPTHRYESPTALAEDIARHQSNEPILAGAPSLTTRIVKRLRRHRAACLVATVVVAAAIGALLLAKHNPTEPEPQQLHFTVTVLADAGPGSLRQTIADAPSGSTLRFAPELDGGTIALAGQPLDIDRSLVIDAPESGITIDIGGANRGIVIREPSAVVGLSGLTFTAATVTDAIHGALVNVGATVRVERCRFTGNTGDGVVVFNDAGGKLIMESCLISENHGTGIFSNAGGDLTLIGCTIANNRSEGNPAIMLRSKGRMVRCTVANNVGTPPDVDIPDEGGWPFQYGAAIGTHGNSILEMEHCTISGNSGPSCGGIQVGFKAELTLKNTLIAGNISTQEVPRDVSADISAVRAGVKIHTLGGNFIGNDAGLGDYLMPERYNAVTKFFYNRKFGDQIGTHKKKLDPQLAPLGDHDGPVPTMPPLPDSPVIDATRDEGGIDGDGDGKAKFDIGAVEYAPASP